MKDSGGVTMKRILTMLLTLGLMLTVITGCGSNEQPDKKSQTNNKETIIEEVDEMRILIRGEQNESIVFQLNDSNAAKSLYDQLPITIDLEDYSNNEKIFYPSKKLDVNNTPMAKGPAGTLAYYEPWGDVVMYYDDCGGANGLYALGKAISGADLISQLGGSIEIIKYSGDTKQQDNTGKQIGNSEPTIKEVDPTSQQNDGMHHIQIKIGSNTFTASLYDNDTVRELLERFSMDLRMDELHGNEKYYYFSNDLPSAAQSVSQTTLEI